MYTQILFLCCSQAFLELVKDKAFAGHIIERYVTSVSVLLPRCLSFCRDTVSHRLSVELYDSSSSGALINLKNVLLSKKIALTDTTIIGTMEAPGGHKKNTSSLPG